MWSLDSVTYYQDKFVSFDWKMLRFDDLTPEQLRAIEDDIAFNEALDFNFWRKVSDIVDQLIINH